MIIISMLMLLLAFLIQLKGAEAFYFQLNYIHPSFRLTLTEEYNSSLPFLDVLVLRKDGSFTTSAYHKPTFTEYRPTGIIFFQIPEVKFNFHFGTSFVDDMFSLQVDGEMTNIYSIFRDNGYPENVIKLKIERWIKGFKSLRTFCSGLGPVYLKLP